jgi:hypothetical protein
VISWVNNSMDVGDIQLSVNVLMVSEYFPVQKYVIHIYVTQIDVQSNRRPILKSMSDFYVTDICTSDLCPFFQIDVKLCHIH